MMDPAIKIFGQQLNHFWIEKISSPTMIENNKIVTDTAKVCEIFNKFYINTTTEMGSQQDSHGNFNQHPSIKAIQ